MTKFPTDFGMFRKTAGVFHFLHKVTRKAFASSEKEIVFFLMALDFFTMTMYKYHT